MNLLRSAALLALSACTGPSSVDTDPAEETDLSTGMQVITDCDPAVGNICPFAGTGDAGFNGDGRSCMETWLSHPMSVTFSPYGKPVIADWNNHKLRVIEADQTVTTIMGTAFIGDGDFEMLDIAEGAPGTTINLNHPTQQRYFPSGDLLSASWHTHKLRIWSPSTGIGRVMVGSALGFSPLETEPPGLPQSAVGMQLNQPRWVEIDSAGNVIIVDMRNELIRKLDMITWEISTIAGSGRHGVLGGLDDDGAPCDSEAAFETCFAFPNNMNPEPGGAIQFSADESELYIADSEAHIIRVLDMASGQTRVLAGSPGVAGDVDAAGRDARFHFPTGLAFDAGTDTLFVADAYNNKIRALDVNSGEVTTFAGTGEATCHGEASATDDTTAAVLVPRCPAQATAGDGGPALEATLFRPYGVDIDLDGNVVISDTFDHRLRVVYR